MRIAWIGTGRESGGVAGMGLQLLESMLILGCEIDLFTQEKPTEISPKLSGYSNLTVRSVPLSWEWDRWYSRNKFVAFLTSSVARARAYKRLARELIKLNRITKYDCIFQLSQTELFNLGRHRHELPPIIVYPCVHAAGELRWHRWESAYARKHEPFFMHYGARFTLIVRSWLQRRELRKPSKIIGMSQHFNDHLMNDYQVPSSKLAVIYHPIPAAMGVPGPGGPVDGPIRLVYIARISVRKGLELIIELSRRLDDLHGIVTIEVAGGATLWSNYMGHLSELNPRVASYVGELSHDKVHTKLAESDALLLPSRYEPGGLVVGEALAHGTPVVVSDAVGSAEPIAYGCCRRFPDGDVAAFERVVRELIAEIQQDRRSLRALAASEAQRHFAPPVVARRMEELFRGVSIDSDSSGVKATRQAKTERPGEVDAD